MRALICFFLGVLTGILFVIHFHLCEPDSWKKQAQKLEKTEKELYETKLEVRKLWKEKNEAWAIVTKLKRNLEERKSEN